MKRRDFVLLLGTAMTAASTLCAQQKGMPLVGFLSSRSRPPEPWQPRHSPVHQGLAETG
jgi:hypothetical protein